MIVDFSIMGVLLMLFALMDLLQNRYFISKSEPQNRTPVRIGKNFYYIVPEDEYVKNSLRRHRNDDGTLD